MTVREIHNTIRSMLGHIASARDRSWESGEIDSAYNRVAGQFVATRAAFYAKGEIQSIEDIQSLIVSDWQARSNQVSNTVYSMKLAANHAALLNINVFGKYDCNGAIPQGTLTTPLEYSVKLSDSAKVAAPFYETVSLNITDPQASLTSARTLKYDNLDIYEQLKWLANQQSVYHRSGYLVLEGTPFHIAVDGENLPRTTTTLQKKYMPIEGTLLSSTLISPVQLSDRLGTPYYGEHRNHVILAPAGSHELKAYTAPGCIVSYCAITYIRKPKPISLILGSETDLTDNGKVHELLCKMTVTELMGDAADDRYMISLQQQIRDFDNRPA